MNKSWRLTAVLAGLLGVLFVFYFFSNPPATTSMEKLNRPRVLDILADRVSKIEIDRKGTLITFERSNDSVGEYWRLAGSSSHAADATLVQQMLFGLDQFVKANALDPGKPESAPDATGLADPRIVVAYTSAGRRDVLRFGKSSPTDSTIVFYQHDGDPKVYRAKVEVFESFNKPLFQYRSRTLVRYAPHRVTRVEVEYKYVRGNKGGVMTTEYEKSTLERFEEGLERGWYLTKPHRERLDDHAVQKLVTDLANLPAEEYQPEGNPKEQGFNEPQARFEVTVAGENKPVIVHFGTMKGTAHRWVRLPGSGEVAVVENFRFENELPHQRNHFRVRTIFPFSIELVRRMEIEAKDLGKVVLDRIETKKEGESVSSVKWEVTEPKDLRVESERVEAFVGAVVIQNVIGFLGPQDFKMAGLDPAPVQLVVTTKEGKRHVCGFFESAQGYMRKEGVDEIFEVRPDFVRMLQRLELNFINMEVFNIPRADLREFTFEARASAQLQPIYYSMKLDVTANAWSFSDPPHKGMEIDPDKLSAILAMLNYIRADALLGRDDKWTKDYRLVDGLAPATLRIVHAKGVAEMYISEDLSDKVNLPKYYARFSDSKTVFQINGASVSTLKQVPIFKKEPKEEPKDK
jgi:hypothetical protein